MKLYHHPLSRSVRVLITLEEIGVPYDVERVSLRGGDDQPHRRLHPFGQVPLLAEGERPSTHRGSARAVARYGAGFGVTLRIFRSSSPSSRCAR